MEDQYIEIIMLELDFHLIGTIREMRIKHRPSMSQLVLSQKLELSESYVSKVENYKVSTRYNLRTINKAVNLFNVGSYAEIFPKDIVKNDLVRIRLKKLPIKKGKVDVNADGSVDKTYEVVSITPLTEKELELWKAKKLKYLTVIK